MNPAQLLFNSALRYPDNPAVVFGDETLSYGYFADRCARVATALTELGLRTGDTVGIAQHNRPELLETLYGALMAGLIAVPVNVRLHAKEIAYIGTNSDWKALVLSPELNESVSEVVGLMPSEMARISISPTTGERSYEELLSASDPMPGPVELPQESVCWLFYTSGTTGKPKGVMWNHRTVHNIVLNHLADFYSMTPEDVILHIAPLSHASGIITLATFASGANNVIQHTASFEPEATFELIERHAVSAIAVAVPTQIVKLLDEYVPGKHDLSSLHCILYGAAPMYREHLKRALDAFGPILIQGYGQGEAPNTITYLPQKDHERFLATDDPRLASVGFPRTGVEVRVVDGKDERLAPGEVGEVVVRGDIVMAGYWKNPDATAETLRGGWLHTGDLGRFDESGYLYLAGRSKEMIISGGSNIYPREIEEALLTHPDISECAIVGLPDDYWGERVHAVICMKEGKSLTEAEIVEFCQANLASYKKPRSVEFRDSLPKNAYGKVLKRELVELRVDGESIE